jgi:hypothetical protein
MGSANDFAQVYDEILGLSREAFAERHYVVAFHLLAAALHAAYDLDDETRLGTVGALIREQRGWLGMHEQLRDLHELAAPSASGSGTRSLWDVLDEEEQTRQRMLVQRRYLRHSTAQEQL